MEVHVVSKVDNSSHVAFTVESESLNDAEQLTACSIQARPFLLSLSSNNLSYARGGDSMHWWDAFPVPRNCPPPYNNPNAWGIVPAWGYAVVVKTAIQRLPLGTVLWGFWPTAATVVNLNLQAGTQTGDWVDISQHRQELLTIYNEYSEKSEIKISLSSPSLGDKDFQELAWEALFRPTWLSGYLLNRHVFASEIQTTAPIDPKGLSQDWTTEDADLSDAVLLSLSASGKTARCFAYQVFRRPASSGPLGLLQLTTSPSLISEVPQKMQTSIPTKAVAYTDLSESMAWITSLTPSKIVIVDFGVRVEILDQLFEHIKCHPSLQSTKILNLQVGNEQKIYTPQEAQAASQAMSKFGTIRFNSVRVRDAVIRSNGAQALNDNLREAWAHWLRYSHSIMPDIHIVAGTGIRGDEGVEGGWQRLCHGQVGAQEGLVYQLAFMKD